MHPDALSARAMVERYISAKDQNRPFLLDRVFAEDATLEMVVRTATIAFPPITHGRALICDVLVRRFAQTYENVHTFCIGSPPRAGAVDFSCDWLVGMSEKESGLVRVGGGRYRWLFQREFPTLTKGLTIEIGLMESLAANRLPQVMHWLSRTPYPWCPAQAAFANAPDFDELRPLREYLNRNGH